MFQFYFVYFSDNFSLFTYVSNDWEKLVVYISIPFRWRGRRKFLVRFVPEDYLEGIRYLADIIFVNLILVFSPDQIHLSAIYQCDITNSLIVKIQDIRFFTNLFTPFRFLVSYSLMWNRFFVKLLEISSVPNTKIQFFMLIRVYIFLLRNCIMH